MYNPKPASRLSRFWLIVLIFGGFTIIFLFYLINNNENSLENEADFLSVENKSNYNVWLIFTKVSKTSPLRYKFHNLLTNIVNISSVPLNFYIIVDEKTKELARDEISQVINKTNKSFFYKFYNVEICAQKIDDLVKIMTPHFSSKPGTYYSDALFYISLGLYRIAPESQGRAVLLDCDLYFQQDIKLLFEEFDRFKPTALYGLASELTPVYRHVLHAYKLKHKTTFGEYYRSTNLTNMSHPRGFQGYNSGVVLLNLNAIRKSREYSRILQNDTVQSLTKKYKFRGHLGDQDFYTLMGFEYPHLIQTLHCGFNRQLCVWWKDHGYKDVFEKYFQCNHSIVILHGNCNTQIPKLQ